MKGKQNSERNWNEGTLERKKEERKNIYMFVFVFY